MAFHDMPLPDRPIIIDDLAYLFYNIMAGRYAALQNVRRKRMRWRKDGVDTWLKLW